MDLLTNMENSAAEALRQNTGTPSNAQSTDFLQQFGCFDPSNSSDVASNKPDFRYADMNEIELIFKFRYAWLVRTIYFCSHFGGSSEITEDPLLFSISTEIFYMIDKFESTFLKNRSISRVNVCFNL